MGAGQAAPAGSGEGTDEEVVGRIKAGETALYGVLMRRHSLRIARVARRILQNEADVEELVAPITTAPSDPEARKPGYTELISRGKSAP